MTDLLLPYIHILDYPLYYLPMIDYNNYLESVEKKNKKIRGKKIAPLTYKPSVKHWYFNLFHGQSNKE